MNRGRQNGKRHQKRNGNGRFVAKQVEVERALDLLDQLTGVVRVQADNTQPGGYRVDHIPPPGSHAGRV